MPFLNGGLAFNVHTAFRTALRKIETKQILILWPFTSNIYNHLLFTI